MKMIEFLDKPSTLNILLCLLPFIKFLLYNERNHQSNYIPDI